MKFVLPVSLASCLWCLSVACTGTVTSDDPGMDNLPEEPSGEDKENPSVNPDNVLNTQACKQINPGTSPLRRLSNAEYKNTVSDLFGMSGSQVQQAMEGFVGESESLGFRNNADFLAVSNVVAEQFMGAAEKLAKTAAANSSFVGCSKPSDNKACANEFVRKFGLRVYRRPLTNEEAARFDKLFDTALTSYDFKTGVEWTVFAMLQSPNFLFRVEEGQAEDQKNGYTRPTGYEMASRLSYLLWQSMPDDTLFSAAAGGKLNTAEQVAAQAKRMLEDGKAERTLEFFRQWLDTDTLAQYPRDEKVFPNLPTNLGALMQQEVDAFTRHLLLEEGGDFTELVSGQYTFVNKTLAEHYGLQGNFGSDFQKVDVPRAAGVLTQGGFITAHDKATRTSIVKRGVKVRTDVMCEVIPAPPNNVPLNLEALGADLSQKERLELHSTEESCAGCHKLIDPIGMVFDDIDAVGRRRTEDEAGKSIETRSEISESFDLDGTVADAEEMGRKFAGSHQARQCYIDQNFRFFYGRDFNDGDMCSRAKLAKAFADSNYKLKDLLLALTQTDAFLYRPVIQ